ncbi:hypothetical protein GCWU000324_01327 [Kingella oralis ATCC 51147]|uniref:Uncharacterized protein n=1 Tax=Kingella oralis ATCC 51147 TaxID=629741 RepID=C4GGQ8_9NEIS|nr:hypothetical protein GCWU000324_01327 [Kingella oralis ATCC 51147]
MAKQFSGCLKRVNYTRKYRAVFWDYIWLCPVFTAYVHFA